MGTGADADVVGEIVVVGVVDVGVVDVVDVGVVDVVAEAGADPAVPGLGDVFTVSVDPDAVGLIEEAVL